MCFTGYNNQLMEDIKGILFNALIYVVISETSNKEKQREHH